MLIKASLVFPLALALSSPLLAGEREMALDTIPAGATVELGGSAIGTTPLRMVFPTAYFQPPNTIWARHLGAPLKITLLLSGYLTKTVEIGDGPRSWASLNGANHFDYYLLRPAYTIKLDPVTSAVGASPASNATNESSTTNEILAMATALEKLAQLRDQGILTAGEFEAKKRQLLGTQPAPTERHIDPLRLCSNLLGAMDHEHKLDTTSSPLLPTASGPIVRCLWRAPDPVVSLLTFYVQCGIPNTKSSCSSISGEKVLGDDPALSCHALLGTDLVYIFENGCVALASASGDQAKALALVQQVVQAFIINHHSR